MGRVTYKSICAHPLQYGRLPITLKAAYDLAGNVTSLPTPMVAS